jgi:hypothetical protein
MAYYVIVNDSDLPWHYYTGQGFCREIDTTVELSGAKVFLTLLAATVHGPLHQRPDLYALGWRVVPLQ